jgi:hypothetical protein
MSDYELEGGLQDLPEDVWKVNLMDITCSFTSEQFRRVAVREAVDGAVRCGRHCHQHNHPVLPNPNHTPCAASHAHWFLCVRQTQVTMPIVSKRHVHRHIIC